MAKIRGPLKDIAFDETYPFIDKSLKFKLNQFACYTILYTAAAFMNKLRYGFKVEGMDKIRRNRKLIENGVMTVCNHVYRWDMMCVLLAMRFRRSNILMYAQPFRGKDNWFMRTIGGIPIPDERSGLRKFNETLDTLAAQHKWLHVFPESCSWKFYSPIRPFMIGTFNLAYKYNYPILPFVITFRERTGIYKYFYKDEPLVTLHVGDPIIPDTTVPRKAEAQRLRDLTHSAMLEMAGIVSNPWPAGID